MDASFNLLPFELSLEEKIKIVQNQKSISDIYEQKYLSLPVLPNWDCAKKCWGQFSNCWKGLDYLKRGSESWATEVNKCFGDVSKCYKKCEKRKMLEDQYSEALKFNSKSDRRICIAYLLNLLLSCNM